MNKQTGQLKHKSRLLFGCFILLILTALIIALYHYRQPILDRLGINRQPTVQSINPNDNTLAINALSRLDIKPTLSGDDYERKQFGSTWADWRDCNVRQKILNRDIINIKVDKNGCTVISGILNDPYTGQEIKLNSKSAASKKVQIDHVVALSNAWQTGAKNWNSDKRKQLANDDLELIAVSSQANQEKSDSDASSWLPSNRNFRCRYIARQIAVKLKYQLWITAQEHSTMAKILSGCPDEPLPTAR